MTGDRLADAIFYALIVILPLSALLARRIPIVAVLRNVVIWIVIFGIGLVLVGQADRFRPLWDDTRAALFGEDQSIEGETVRIRMAPDGHFWGDVSLNGTRRRMLIDSGATITAISSGTAAAAGLEEEASPFPVVIRTANGTISARRSRVDRLELGSIAANDLPVVVSDAFGDVDVIGMNFLSRLGSWRVEGRVLILDPPPENHDRT